MSLLQHLHGSPAASVALVVSPLSLILLGLVGLHILSAQNCIAIGCLFLAVIAWRSPLFRVPPSAIEANDIHAGTLLTLCTSFTAVILQLHHPLIGYAINRHSYFTERPLARLMRTTMFVELALNGLSDDKAKLGSWLRHIHRHVRGTIPASVLAEAGLEDIDATYGYTPELMAYIVETLAWSVIAFHRRFGRRDQMNESTLDAIVLRFTCMGRQIGVPEHLLGRNYQEFIVSFQARLNAIAPRAGEPKGSIRPRVVSDFERTSAEMGTSWLKRCIFKTAWLLGVELLPADVRSAYDLSSRPSKLSSFALTVSTWFIDALYLRLPWLPLRGMIALVCATEPGMRDVFQETLRFVRSIDEFHEKPVQQTYEPNDSSELIDWLSTDSHSIDRSHPHATLLQCLSTRAVQVQVHVKLPVFSTPARIACWMILACMDGARLAQVQCTRQLSTLRCNLLRRDIMSPRSGKAVTLPHHVGCVMDGNRRYARSNGLKSVLVGHARGASIAMSLLAWWANLAAFCDDHSSTPRPRVLTLWALSSDNLKRPKEELDGLLLLLAREIRMIALSTLVHQLKLRVCVIGSASATRQFPEFLQDVIAMVEHETARYSSPNGLVLQIAVGYGGQEEIVEGVRRLTVRGEDVTVASLSRQTYSALNGVSPVNLIVRTSERRTSGFLLWETQGAEICFIDKLWPELNQTDWLSAMWMYGKTEQRFGR